MMAFISFFAVLFFIILAHELGHLLASRYFGIHTKELSIGFGKRLISRKLSGTVYSLKLFPIGGSVSLLGENPTEIVPDELKDRSYSNLPPGKKIWILVMGPAFGIIAAFILLLFASFQGDPVFSTEIGKLAPNGPAEISGLKVGDIVKSINGQAVSEWKQMIRIAVSFDNEVIFEVSRNGDILKIAITPEFTDNGKIFGIASADPIAHKDVSFIQANRIAASRLTEYTCLILKSLKMLVTGEIDAKEVSGPVYVIYFGTQIASKSFVKLLILGAYLSITLSIFNMLPIPLIDGGRIALCLYEISFKKSISERSERLINSIGVGIILFIMVYALFRDLDRLIQ